MNKKSKIYILLLIWTAAIVQFFVNKGVDREEKIVEAIALTKATEYNSEISAYGYYGNGFMSDETKKNMVVRLADKLGIKSGYGVTFSKSSEGEVATLYKEGLEGDTKLQIISVNTSDANGNIIYENYIAVKIVLHEKTDLSGNISSKIREIYEKIGIEPVMNLYVGGSAPGKLSEEEMKKEVDDFLDMMAADKICEEKFGEVYTVYGYSKDISDFVYQNEDKVNVNIAFSYDEAENLTRIHMAVPFVDKSY